MNLFSRTREVARVLGEAVHIAPALRYKLAGDDEAVSLGSLFEDTVARSPNNTMLIFEGRVWTYAEFNAEVNQLAHLLSSRGVQRGDSIALLMENRAEYLLSVLALVKLGAAASLINNSLSGDGLVHCLRASNAKGCIVGEERVSVFDAVREQLDWPRANCILWMRDSESGRCPRWARDALKEMVEHPESNPESTSSITAGEPALYIFTSGTTGLPKAAIMYHRRILGAGHGLGRLGFRVQPTDRLYLCLPVYHITGLGPGFCAFIAEGGSIFLRRSFSASSFWREVRQHQTNCFIYVGEICRYLAAQEPTADERDNPLEKMLGNGLRPDVWTSFKERFGVDRICEIYGSSEGNVTFANLLNKDRTIGAALAEVAVVRYDTESDEIVRNGKGRCIPVKVGEPGLLLGAISEKAQFDGYTDKAATEKKIVRDVKKDGDRWFNTGDLVRQIDVGFALGLKHFQFVDRTGDTFRWRAENVSTNEVGEVINQHPQITMANVYGVEVPGAEGRAGMVAFSVEGDEPLDLAALDEIVDRDLPVYARPVFVRVLSALDTTGTFKLVKTALREQAFHPDQVGRDEIYVRKPRSSNYEPLDDAFYEVLKSGQAGY